MSEPRPRLLLIANPRARRMGQSRHLDIARILVRRYEVETVCSSSAQHVRELAAGAGSRGFTVVGAMGGDGMVSNVVSGLAGAPVCLAIIPAGTANASARSLGIPAHAVRAARALVVHPVRRPVPVARLTLTTTAGVLTRYALSQIGVGLDAEVVRRVESSRGLKRRFGELYFAAVTLFVLARLLRQPPSRLKVTCGARQTQAVSVVVQVRWPYTYLGPLRVALTPAPSPGLAVLVIEAFTARAIAATVPRTLTSHSFRGCPGVRLWSGCDRLLVEAAPEVVAQADGEPLGMVSKLEVDWIPDGLVLANPAGALGS